MKTSCPIKTIFLVSIFLISLLVFFRKNPNFFAFSDSTQGNFYLNQQMVRANEHGSTIIELDPVPSLIHDLTPSFSGTVTTDNDTYIYSVEYSIDGDPPEYNEYGNRYGYGISCQAKDGNFDSYSEDFTCQIYESLANGEHTIYIWARSDDESVSDHELLETTFTIENPNPPVADFPQVFGEVYATAVSDDGKTLYIGGYFYYVYVGFPSEETVEERHNLAAIDLETMLVTDWNPSGWLWEGPVYDIEVDGDYILIGGGFKYGSFGSEFAKISQNDGLADENCMPIVLSSSNPDPSSVHDIKLTNDYIYLGGSFIEIDGVEVAGLARLNRDTCELDNSWLPKPNYTVHTIEVIEDDVFIGGDFNKVNGLNRGQFAKISASTGAVSSACIKNFNYGEINSLKAHNNYLYVGGFFDDVSDPVLGASFLRYSLVRLKNDNNCSLDQAWTPNFYADPLEEEYPGTIFTIDVDEADNSIYVGGHFNYVGSQYQNDFVKLDINTGLADSWNPYLWTEPILATVHSSLITNNYLIVAGDFDQVGTEERHSLAAFPYEKATSPTPEPPASSSTNKDKKDHKDKKETVQIPHAVKKLFGLIVAKPVKDSNTNGQEVLSIVFKDTLDFDAYLSVNHAPVGDLPMIREQNNQAGASNPAANKGNLLIAGWQGHQLMGFKENKTIYWQIGNIQQMFYKAYPASGKEAAVIIPEVQHKSSIIALKYNKSQLIPPGEPNTKFSELKLKLAHSTDGINWRIMSNSVVDPINNTVAAIDKLGGYYVIVASY